MNKKEFPDLFQELKKRVDFYLSKDNRELNYQNRVIIPLLEKLFENKLTINVVDVSTLYRNWEKREWHDRSKYGGVHTPDILVAENWNIRNKDDGNIKYLLLIEVKTPDSKDKKRTKEEVGEYLEHVPNVILTDCITWEFYTKATKDNPHIYYLEKEGRRVCERKSKEAVNWKELPENTQALPEERYSLPEEWEGILGDLIKMICTE